jgi:hypothetical protein
VETINFAAALRVHHRTTRRFWQEARPDIVGATTKQQIEAFTMRGEDCIAARGDLVGRGPVAGAKLAVIRRVRDYAPQRYMFPDSELS